MRSLERFWPVDRLGNHFQSGGILEFERIFARFFWGFSFFTWIIFLYKTIFLKELNYICWIPDRYIFTYNFVRFCQSFFMFLGLPLVTSFDILYMAFCFRLMIQFRLVAQILNKIDSKTIDSGKEFIESIQHHAFLIKFVEQMKNVYVYYLLIQYITTLLIICIQIFQLLSK